MTRTYPITDLHSAGDRVIVTATAESHGALTISDISYGRTADAFFGEGRDVEVCLQVSSKAVNQLCRSLFGYSAENAADEMARSFASVYEGDAGALRKIQSILDRDRVAYEKRMWP